MPLPDNLRGEDIKELAKMIKEELSHEQKKVEDSHDSFPRKLPNADDIVRPTGIDGLDEILRGGFPTDSTVLLAGASGTGKTILSMQWLFEGFTKYGEPGLYVSLTEPVNKIIKNVEKMEFAASNNVSVGRVHVEDLRSIMFNLGLENKELTVEDIDAIIDKLSDLMLQTGAKRIVIDSITAIAYRLRDRHLIRTFVYHLDALLAQNDVNVILISEVTGNGYSIFGVEEFISDGIIKLSRSSNKGERVNKLQVVKMRGIDFDPHKIAYRITTKGVNLYNRLSRELVYNVSQKRISTGVPGLDDMTHGGYFEGSSILLTGSSGTGKSLVSLQFLLQGVKDGRKSLLVSFEESRDQILRNAKGFGWDFEQYEQSGNFKMLVAYPEQKYLEEHISMITDTIEEFGANLVVIDSLSSLGNVFSEDILRDFVSRLNAYMKEKLVTAIFTNATSTLLGASQITDAHLSTITDQIIMLRYVEIQSELHHALLILKMRGSRHDKKLREVSFTETGIAITHEFTGLEGVMSGSTRRVSKSVEDQLHDLFLETFGPMGETIFNQEKGKGISVERMNSMIEELGNQGIISQRKKEEFREKSTNILGGETDAE